MSPNPEKFTARDPSSLRRIVATLTGVVAAPHYPARDRAALKRWAPGQALPLAFYRLWLRHLGQDLPYDHQCDAWMTLAWGVATMGSSAHRPERPFGRALAEAGFAEGRLERLLAAPDELRNELFMSAVRFLAAKDEGFDWTEAAEFLLSRDANKRQAIHRRIAEAYYRHLGKEE